MNLVLWRHAQVEPSMLADWQRELSEEGLINAQHAAHYLNTALPIDCRVLVSPAKRAIQTASALQRPYEIVDALAPRTNVQHILEALDWPQLETSDSTVVVVGHQPSLGLLIAHLTAENREFNVENTIAYWLSNREENGQRAAFIKGLFGPGGMRWRDNT